jgi:hypothetical protein
MSTALGKAKAKLRRRPVLMTVMQVVIPETGELVGALVPSHPIDRRAMRERKFHVGKELRAELKQARNPQFWRKAHVLGGFLADHVAGFEGLSHHDAIKRLQEESGIGCITETFELPGLGKCTRQVAESLNFDDMDEGRFLELWQGAHGEGGWIGWLREHKFGGLDAIRREEVELLIMGEQA